MWDLTIPGHHDFYIVTAAADILVHNCSDELSADELRAQAGGQMGRRNRPQGHLGRCGSPP
jgi:hypothetical protein